MTRDELVRIAYAAVNGREGARLLGCAVDDLQRFGDLYAAEQVAAATARDSAIIKMVDEARTAGRYSDAEEWDVIDAAIRARAQEEGK